MLTGDATTGVDVKMRGARWAGLGGLGLVCTALVVLGQSGAAFAATSTVPAAQYTDADPAVLPAGSGSSWGTPGSVTFPDTLDFSTLPATTETARAGAVLPPGAPAGCTREILGVSLTVLFGGSAATPNPGAMTLALSNDSQASVDDDVTYSANLFHPAGYPGGAGVAIPNVAETFTATFDDPQPVAGVAAILSLDTRESPTWTIQDFSFEANDICQPTIAGTPTAATVGQGYSFTPTVTNATGGTYAITAGVLPTGLSLDPATGTIAGTPTNSGTYQVTESVTTSAGTADIALTIDVVSAAVSMPTPTPTPPAAAATPPTSGGPSLADSGSDAWPFLGVGTIALVLGVVAVTIGCRRRSAE